MGDMATFMQYWMQNKMQINTSYPDVSACKDMVSVIEHFSFHLGAFHSLFLSFPFFLAYVFVLLLFNWYLDKSYTLKFCLHKLVLAMFYLPTLQSSRDAHRRNFCG